MGKGVKGILILGSFGLTIAGCGNVDNSKSVFGKRWG